MTLRGRWRTPAEEPELSPATAERHAVAFREALARLGDGGGARLLDLGPVVGANLEVFRRVARSVVVADLAAACGLGESVRHGEPDRAATAVEAVLASTSEQVDLVLAWDLLNYLSLDAVALLCTRLAERSAPGAALHAFVATGAVMPARPGRWIIRARDRLVLEASTAAERPAPCWLPAVVEKTLSGFRVERSVVLPTAREILAVREEA
jgi:hypothetical protein